jgi:hypothetical protein
MPETPSRQCPYVPFCPIDALTDENAALRDYKRRAELFLLSQGLELPRD